MMSPDKEGETCKAVEAFLENLLKNSMFDGVRDGISIKWATHT